MSQKPITTSYWGEIPEVAETESGIAAIEREQITKPRPMDVEGPLLYQPSSRHHPPTNDNLPSEHFAIDPIVHHTIRLLQHIKKLKATIANIGQDIKPELDANISLPTIEQTREMQGLPEISEHESTDTERRDFALGIGPPQPNIDEFACRKLLRRSTAAICAHLSFDTTQESVLETLTDICEEFITQFIHHLGVAVDRRGMLGVDGFPDAIERVFNEMGLGTVTDLHEFYQNRILLYHNQIQKQCEQVHAEYQTLVKQPSSLTNKSPNTPNTGDTLHVIRIKEEPSTEIQFPLLDENDDVNDTEQLLNIESLGSFEITVEHETATGLTTEVDSHWPGKDSRQKSSTDDLEPDAVMTQTPQSNNPRTPHSNIPSTPVDTSVPTPRESDEVIQEPGSVTSMEIFSPSLSGPSKAKKKKK